MLLFFSVARSLEIGSGERAVEGPTSSSANGTGAAAVADLSAGDTGVKPGAKAPAKVAAKTPAKPKLGEFNIPGYISSPFQAHQWLDAA